MYSSAVPMEPPSPPPTMRTSPLFSIVAVGNSRAVVRLPVTVKGDDDATVNVVEPLIEPDAATIVVAPAVMPVARPVLLIVATPLAVEVQMTELVRFCVLLSA